MASTMSSYGIAISGLHTARLGLTVTGHNVSNTGTPGYVRQQAIQKDAFSTKIGNNSVSTLQIGMGSDVAEIRQIRDMFLDRNYRDEVSKANYHSVRYETGTEVEMIFGELESMYSMHGVLSDMWDSLNELSIHPDGIETRATFIANCQSFINKINNIGERLIDYQMNLNQRVKETVYEVNQKVAAIDEMNQKIRMAEARGENPNDYEDARNLAMDELSELVGASYKYDKDGSVCVLINGSEVLANGVVQKVGLQYTDANSPFVKPIITNLPGILPYDADTREVYPNLADSRIDHASGDDRGMLKGLLTSRGDQIATYATDPESVENYLIPSIQQKFDTLVNEIVTMINNAFAPENHNSATAPYGLDGSQFTEIFVRNTSTSGTAALPRYDANGIYNAENTNNYYSMYTIGNIQINSDLLTSDGYNKIALSHMSDTGEILRGDNNIILDIMSKWKTEKLDGNGLDGLGGLSVDNFYRSVITDIGVKTNEAKGFLESQTVLIDKINNDRQTISGVSLDEEMTNMMKYQHAYNSSAKVLTIIDSMVDEIVNRLIR